MQTYLLTVLKLELQDQGTQNQFPVPSLLGLEMATLLLCLQMDFPLYMQIPCVSS